MSSAVEFSNQDANWREWGARAGRFSSFGANDSWSSSAGTSLPRGLHFLIHGGPGQESNTLSKQRFLRRHFNLLKGFLRAEARAQAIFRFYKISTVETKFRYLDISRLVTSSIQTWSWTLKDAN